MRAAPSCSTWSMSRWKRPSWPPLETMAVSPSTASKCWWGRPAQPSGSSSTNPRRMPRTHHGLTRAPKTGSTFADDAQCHLRPSGFRDRTLRVRHLLYLLSHPTGGDRLTRARKGTQISNPARSSRRGFFLVQEGTHDAERQSSTRNARRPRFADAPFRRGGGLDGAPALGRADGGGSLDRKSTRLNSSH